MVAVAAGPGADRAANPRGHLLFPYGLPVQEWNLGYRVVQGIYWPLHRSASESGFRETENGLLVGSAGAVSISQNVSRRLTTVDCSPMCHSTFLA